MEIRTRWFWVALVVIVILAAVPRLLIYDFSLPYIDHPDEGTSYLEALHWRGLYDLGGGHPGYPPGHISVNWLVQNITEGALSGNITTTIHVMRLLSVAFNLATLVVIAWFARFVAGNFAGLMAGLLWGFSPMVIANGVIAIPDPLLYLLVALSLAFAGYAVIHPHNHRFGLWSFIVGLLAVTVKYQAFPVLVAGGLVSLVVMRRDWRIGLRYLLIQAVLTAVVGVFLIYGYGAFRSFGTNRETVEMSESGTANLFDVERVLNNIASVFTPVFALDVLIFTTIVGVIAYGYALRQRQPTIKVAPLLVTLPVLILVPWIASSFTYVTPEGTLIRHVMPVTTLACVLFSAAVAQLVMIVSSSQRHISNGIAMAFVLLIFFAPAVDAIRRMVPEYQLPDSRVEMRHWADTNLEAGTVIVDETNHKTFNPYWGGLQGRQWFDWWETDDFTQYTVEEWRDERGMAYAVLPVDEWDTLQSIPEGEETLSQMLFLRAFDQQPNRARAVRFYRLWRMEHETDVRFGDAIRLVGYDAPDPDTIALGQSVPLRFYWQAEATPLTNYSLYIHLTAVNSRNVIAQLDGAPAVPERPTVTWTNPTETLISPVFEFSLPDDLPEGEYRIIMGLYDFETFERLPVADSDSQDAYSLLTFAVEQ